MSEETLIGRVHSLQSMGTLDGPGVRFVVFLQGCPLRCKCCHNPDTWQVDGGREYTAEELIRRIVRFREYFGADGGVTVSGGEPLLQAAIVRELFMRCHDEGIHTCLDTSGCMLGGDVEALLAVTDRVLLDVKYTCDEQYRENVGCGIAQPMRFLARLQTLGIPTTLRQVIIPTLNDSRENILALKEIAKAHPCVDGIELLPFRKICAVKYEQMGIAFPLLHLAEPTRAQMQDLQLLLAPEF